jgi:hypothetical protein
MVENVAAAVSAARISLNEDGWKQPLLHHHKVKLSDDISET